MIKHAFIFFILYFHIPFVVEGRTEEPLSILWMEVNDIVQETGIKTIPKEKKCKKAKWLSEETLQIAVKRREVKSESEVAQACPTLSNLMQCSLPGSSSMGFFRQEYWSRVPLPSPMYEREK